MEQRFNTKPLLISLVLALSACSQPTEDRASARPPIAPPSRENVTLGDFDFHPGDYSESTLIGNSLPGTWRPFAASSPWNTPIAPHTPSHPESENIITFATSQAKHLRIINSYLPPIWVVNASNARSQSARAPAAANQLQWVHLRSPNIFDTWDRDRNGETDIPIPLSKGMYPEPTRDGHICIIDPFLKRAYEMSKYDGWKREHPHCTTFNIWDLTGSGVGDPNAGTKWWARGGRGSGFPVIAGLLRPEELAAGKIRHALIFTFSKNRKAVDNRNIMMHPPACRSDGRYIGSQYPIEGMQFQLNPSLTEDDFNKWGLTPEGKVLARALQEYGMFLGDNGGDMALVVQLLGPSRTENRNAWDSRFPGFYDTVNTIPVSQFRVVDTGKATLR